MSKLFQTYDILQGRLDIHLAEREDAELIREMLIEAAQWMMTQGIDQWRPEQFTLDEILSYFDYRDVYLVYSGGEPAALFTLQDNDPEYWGSRNITGYSYLHRLTVKQSFRSLGMGRELVKWAAEKSVIDEKKGLRLDCIGHNVRLNLLYQQLGFQFMGMAVKNGREYSLYEKLRFDDVDGIHFIYFSEKDFMLLQKWSTSTDILLQWAGSSWDAPVDAQDLHEYIKGANDPGKSKRLVFTVTGKETGEKIGHISLEMIDRYNRSARLDKVVIGNPNYRGLGNGRKIVDEMLRIGFGALDLHKISLVVSAYNNASIKLFESAGFKKEGLLREQTLYKNEYWDVVIMGIVRHEWEA